VEVVQTSCAFSRVNAIVVTAKKSRRRTCMARERSLELNSNVQLATLR
jgi:hypothetical protein